MKCHPLLLLSCTLLAWAGCTSTRQLSRNTGPWDLARLDQAPAYTHGSRTGLVEEVYFDGEPLNGKPTRVFAYLGRPANNPVGKSPAMVLVHGGGGKAFSAWAQHWAERGYVAIAMDLAGNGPTGRLPDGGPDQADATKFRNFPEAEAREMWTYHAVAAVIRAHSLVRSLPEVDRNRTGLTGISWGGYLTCLVAGLDHRFKVAVPVYGCGFLGHNSVWKDGSLAAMAPDARERWIRLFDPGQYLVGVSCPILFLNGTTDFAYPLDSYQKSYRLVREPFRNLSIVTNLPHGHIWTFGEVDAFVDHALRGGPSLGRLSAVRLQGDVLSARLDAGEKAKQAILCYTTDAGPWQKRRWSAQPAEIRGREVRSSLPVGRPLVAYLAVIDERGLRTSSDFIERSE